MKHAYFWAGLLAVYLPGAAAVEFNTDTLKSMQEEGHKIVAEETGWRTFRLPTGKCLHAGGEPGKVGANLKIQNCDPQSNNQKWRLDGQARLVSHGGTCVGVVGNVGTPGANAVMQSCGATKSQQWRLDGKKRLVNGFNSCLQAADPTKPGANVAAAACSGSPGQVWQ